MANHKSTKKSIRKDQKRTLINKSRKSNVRTFLKKVALAINAGDKKVASEALSAAHSRLAKGVNKGILKLNTISRKVSRLSKKIKQLEDLN
ncbi:ribosomal protein S20 [Orientia chuto str. Dubai]|uniref:Small ribosomal subunit protein bS20 n=1 Tax=Orientia chuto str. Dubai TaxID=1359168 RepID=A0A0F3MHL6_9RICK|nr:30S ribosomal protein S20 [Candidatus Orientia mediorientalis]KJV55258.1 ribosomal protein S20 [Orientia chuto str. Dubai]